MSSVGFSVTVYIILLAYSPRSLSLFLRDYPAPLPGPVSIYLHLQVDAQDRADHNQDCQGPQVGERGRHGHGPDYVTGNQEFKTKKYALPQCLPVYSIVV